MTIVVYFDTEGICIFDPCLFTTAKHSERTFPAWVKFKPYQEPSLGHTSLLKHKGDES